MRRTIEMNFIITIVSDILQESIEYLFPCGLFQPDSKPIMKPPEEIYPARKEASFDVAGRPYHPFFYTSAPNLYQHISVRCDIFIDLIYLQNTNELYMLF